MACVYVWWRVLGLACVECDDMGWNVLSGCWGQVGLISLDVYAFSSKYHCWCRCKRMPTTSPLSRQFVTKRRSMAVLSHCTIALCYCIVALVRFFLTVLFAKIGFRFFLFTGFDSLLGKVMKPKKMVEEPISVTKWTPLSRLNPYKDWVVERLTLKIAHFRTSDSSNFLAVPTEVKPFWLLGMIRRLLCNACGAERSVIVGREASELPTFRATINSLESGLGPVSYLRSYEHFLAVS